MAIDLIVKAGDTRDWKFTLSDTDNTALVLTGARVKFAMRSHEWADTDFFARDTGGTNSDYIAVSDPATLGVVRITPRAADWAALSDGFGVFVAEFAISDSSFDLNYVEDILIRVDEPVVDW